MRSKSRNTDRNDLLLAKFLTLASGGFSAAWGIGFTFLQWSSLGSRGGTQAWVAFIVISFFSMVLLGAALISLRSNAIGLALLLLGTVCVSGLTAVSLVGIIGVFYVPATFFAWIASGGALASLLLSEP